MARRRLSSAAPPPPGKPTPVPNYKGAEWMGRDEMVPVLPLPLAAFEAIWEWARARQQLAEQHNGAWPEEYKTMMGWIVQWGEDTAVEVLGREPAPVKKPVPKAPRKKKPPPEKPKPRYRLKRR